MRKENEQSPGIVNPAEDGNQESACISNSRRLHLPFGLRVNELPSIGNP